MKIVVLNGNPNKDFVEFEDYLSGMADRFTSQGHEVKRFDLRDMDIKQCTGCWDCWVKTPGKCRFQDSMEEIYWQVPVTDQLILASPIIAGYLTGLLKTTQDRLIPLLHPHIMIVDNECHHYKRYEHYPRLSAVLAKEESTDEEDLEIIGDLIERVSRNMRGGLGVVTTMDQLSSTEVANEISNL